MSDMDDVPTPSPEVPGVSAEPRRRRPWMKAYDERIAAGQERCRVCGTAEDLTVARLRYDREWAMSNATILCHADSDEYFDDFQPYQRKRLLVRWRLETPSLYSEEQDRPATERWGLTAIDDARRAKYCDR